MRSNRTARALAALALTFTVTLTATACGSDDSDSDSAPQVSATEHNDADVAFATDMLQHHAQALSMVDLTRGRTLTPEVQQLAEAIRDAQAPEIETFTDWLTDWHQEIPATMRDHSHAGHGEDMSESMEGMDTDMPGMMSADDMTALQDAPDADFQQMWLEMMTAHHEGAVQMATTETTDGQYKPAIDLADSIVTSQTKEIDTMKALLN